MMEDIKNQDIIVIGGGPCGSFSALNAVRQDVKVLVLEEHKEIGIPKHCAGLLSVNGLKLLNLSLPSKLVENIIYGAIFYSPCGEKFSLSLETPVSYVVDRALFDQYIAKLAMNKNVEYLFEAKAKSLLFTSKKVHGVIFKKGNIQMFRESKIVIDAEGCGSKILRKTGLSAPNNSMIFKGVQSEIEGVEDIDEEMVEIYLGRRFAPGFFAWIIPKRNGLAKVGLASKFGNPKENLMRFMEKHPVASKKLKKSRIISLSFHPLTLGGPIKKTYGNGLLVVGDAASHVKPTTGGGVIFGMLGARIAGAVAYEALRTNDFSERFLSKYQVEWNKAMGSDLKIMYVLRKILMHIPDEKLDSLIVRCKKLELNRMLEAKGDMDFQGNSLLRLARNPRGMALLMHLFLSFFLPSIHVRNKNER